MTSLKAPFTLVFAMLLSMSMMGCLPKTFKSLATTDDASSIQKLDAGTTSSEADKNTELDETSTTALEPTSVAGGFLMDPKKLKIERTAATVDITADPGAVMELPSALPKDTDIELYAYDSASRNFEANNDFMILNLKKLGATRSAADGSFTLQSNVANTHWIFVKVVDSSGATLKVTPKEPKASIVWIDSDGNRPRSMDQASAYTLRGLISPTISLLEAIDRLKTTKACVDCDLNGADLRGQNWNAYNFMGAKLMGAKFNNSSLTNSDVRYTDLRAVDFSVCYLALSDFTGAQTAGANFQGADTQNAIGLVISP